MHEPTDLSGYLRIGDVARILRVSDTTLRKWDREGGRLRSAARSAAGYRLYHPADVRAILRTLVNPRDWRSRIGE